MIYKNLFIKNKDKSKIGKNMTKDTKKTDNNNTDNLLMSLKANEKAKKRTPANMQKYNKILPEKCSILAE